MRAFLLVILMFFAAALVALVMQKPSLEDTRTISLGGAALQVEIADTRAERSQGLSGRKELGENKGMLFVLETEGQPAFWMKNMRFAVDILWIDSGKKVVQITKNAAPESCPERFRPQVPVLYVLEVPAGWAERHNIQPGTVLSLEN